MDRIRTVYLDSLYAEEQRPGEFHYNVVGGLSVPEGSRVYVDNISFTNVFSNDSYDILFQHSDNDKSFIMFF